MQIKISDDYELLARLNKHVHDIHVGLNPELVKPHDYEAFKDFFKGIIHKENYLFLLAEEAGEAIGYAWLEVKEYPENPFKYGYKALYVHQISINQAYRNGGYGTKLMDKIETLAEERGLTRVELDYWAENVDAAAFYEKRGFLQNKVFVHKEV
ncbi:GNAT family N-acetyltransferase [Thalassobacillus hwangdonensis]|uniref:GNAT family N-acetyltransferase n=1 Tax=Thalassobacillus hwangdonensis TaxID=546108 RepID=A0ABW3L710_9BACI